MTAKSLLIVVPVYNHSGTLGAVLDGLKPLGRPILVVDDGSSDGLRSVLAKHADIYAIHHPVNKGKGAAIASAMRFAAQEGYRAILTFDADGQHLPSDVPKLIAIHERNPEALIMGARDFESKESGDVPGSSKFGRSLSNYCIWFQTGSWLSDTQTGLRIYPVDIAWLKTIRGYRFSFESEAITRLIWQGREAITVPVSTFYPDRKLRISHFHAFVDIFWITLTHGQLFVLQFLRLLGLYHPLRLTRKEVRGHSIVSSFIKYFGTRTTYALMIFPVLSTFVLRAFERRSLVQFYAKARPGWPRIKQHLGAFLNFLQFGASIVDRTNPEGAMLVKPRITSGEASTPRALPKGAILLGAHYGDWALIAKRINPHLTGTLGLVADPKITPKFFEDLEKRLKGKLRVIDSRQDVLGFALSVKEILDEDGNVAFLADRTDRDAETLKYPFLGEVRAWPRAPFSIAVRLRKPVIFVSAVKNGIGPSAPYLVEFENLSTGERERRLTEEELLALYVAALEKRVVEKPQHWFNFFPFWSNYGDATTA